jgi:hypothetical protein
MSTGHPRSPKGTCDVRTTPPGACRAGGRLRRKDERVQIGRTGGACDAGPGFTVDPAPANTEREPWRNGLALQPSHRMERIGRRQEKRT